MSDKDTDSNSQTGMDPEFAHARLFLKADWRYAMSFSFMKFLGRAKLGPASQTSAKARLENVKKESSKSKLLTEQVQMNSVHTREQQSLQSLFHVEQWLTETNKYKQKENKFP